MKKEKEMDVQSNIKRCKEDIIFDTVIFIILTFLFLIVAYPLWWVIISSVSDPKAVSGGQVIWRPIGFTMKGYLEVFEDDSIVRSFLNSVLYT
ncbi:MAG: carbohydrate ABC transporter permease, partial [Lachnospiraceae bacterium]|nr:carbohydrate ABC transporter permease [Lachnospiraceae bacterium]